MEDIAIHCPTKEIWIEVHKLIEEYKLGSGSNSAHVWHNYGEQACLSMKDTCYARKSWYESNGFTVISYDQFLERFCNKLVNTYPIY